MSEAPAAPATSATPTNGNGSTSLQTPAVQAPKTDTATGPQGMVRGPDGKFVAKAPAAPEAPPPPRFKHKDVDLDAEAAYSELMRARQTGKLLTEAQKRHAAADAKERALKERVGSYASNLDELFKEAGLDGEESKRRVAEWLYSRHIEPGTLTPEQKALKEAQAKLAEYQGREKQAAEEKQKAERAKVSDEQAKELEQTILSGLDQSGVPRSRWAVARAAFRMEGFEAKGASISPEQLGALLRDDYRNEAQNIAEAIEAGAKGDKVAAAERYREHVGPEAWKRVVSWALAWGLKQVPAAPGTVRRAAAPEPKSQPSQRMTPQEFMDKYGKR